MSRQITRLAIENVPDFLDYECNSEAIVKALRISGENAPATVSFGDLVALWSWALITGKASELRRVSNAIYGRQYDGRNCIYFIGDPRRKVVKIGLSNDVTRRITSIQTGYPYPLSILCVIPGDGKLEQELQRIFSPLRTNGEWFRYDGRIRAYIGTINAELFARVVGD